MNMFFIYIYSFEWILIGCSVKVYLYHPLSGTLSDCEIKKKKSIVCVLCCEAEATMHDSRPVHGLPGWLQTAGPAGGDERPAHGESPLSSPSFFFSLWRPRLRICLGSTSRLTLVFGSAESGERQGYVSAQEQH